MLDALELLVALSEIDAEIQELTARNEELPEAIEGLEDERSRVRARLADVEGGFEGLAKERKRMERELEDLQAKLADLSAKQLVIKTNEEYAALSHEIGFVKKEIEEEEDAILAILEQADGASGEVADMSRETEAAERDLEQRVVAFRSELSRLGDALAVKRDERLRVAKRIDPATLERYERILASKGDSALALVLGGACSGCYIKLPPQTVIEIKRADRLIECQSCGRILIFRRERESG